ncbi:hypothetical protein [Ilumatobacter sp.]|uniref:hypothetical protein n=1 Tax=Ilumatobacter sp. TaxID=1967498 RepID=UPI003B51C911
MNEISAPSDRRSDTDVVSALLRRSDALIWGIDHDPAAARRVEALDDADGLLDAVALIAPHLACALGLTVSADDRRCVAVQIMSGARSFEAAGPDAIGAVCALLDALTGDDLAGAVEIVEAALDGIDHAELFAAAAALTASIIEVIADRLDLDPRVVLGEVAAASTGVETDGPRRHRTAHEACSSFATRGRRTAVRVDQTWSGRNSQCHGSRGTDSTHPNLGPLTFSH